MPEYFFGAREAPDAPLLPMHFVDVAYVALAKDVMMDLPRADGIPLEPRCALCGSTEAFWLSAVRFDQREPGAVGGLALFFHCRDHHPTGVPGTINGVLHVAAARPPSTAWLVVQGLPVPTSTEEPHG